MKKITFVLALICFGAPARALDKTGALSLQSVFNEIAEKSKPAVVNIQVAHEQKFRVVTPEFYFFGMPEGSQIYRQRIEGVGSGVVIDSGGLVLTNAHVVRGADEIKVTVYGSGGEKHTYDGRVLGADAFLDVALVRISAGRKLDYLKFADSDKCRAGDWAVAVGSPFGLEQTVTVGIVSAVRQTLLIEGRKYHNMIQTDAAINQGNSGGPLLNLDGEIIGINTAIFSPSGASAGIGFAIPAAEVRKVLEELRAGKTIKKGWLGIALAPLDPVMVRQWRLPVSQGAIVESVVKNSPAHKAGLRRGDIITACDDIAVNSPEDIAGIISLRKTGSALNIELIRDGGKKTAAAVLEDAPAESRSLGIVEDSKRPAPELCEWEGMSAGDTADGVRVSGFNPGSRLYGYLAAGDVINSVNRQPVRTVAELKDALKGASLAEGVVFDISREGVPIYISVQAK